MTHPVEDPESVLVERLKQTLRGGAKQFQSPPRILQTLSTTRLMYGK